MTDLTQDWQQAVLQAASAAGMPQDQLTKLRQQQLLRSLANKAAFTKAALEVAHNVAALRQYLRDNQRQYAQLGVLPEAERDRVEEEVGAYVRSCSANIDKLQALLAVAVAAAAGGAPDGDAAAAAAAALTSPASRWRAAPSPDMLAHRQGQVLILSERLRAATAMFDRLRSLRYQQLQQAEAAQRRRLPQREPTGGGGGGAGQTTQELHEKLKQQQQAAAAAAGAQQPGAGSPGGAAAGGQQQQAQLQLENQALQLELMGMNDQVQHAERTVREIATLNQMFSTAIMQQGEQIEQLYSEAVQATQYISHANVQLGKAVRTNRASRKYLITFFLVASLALLFLDWWNS